MVSFLPAKSKSWNLKQFCIMFIQVLIQKRILLQQAKQFCKKTVLINQSRMKSNWSGIKSICLSEETKEYQIIWKDLKEKFWLKNLRPNYRNKMGFAMCYVKLGLGARCLNSSWNRVFLSGTIMKQMQLYQKILIIFGTAIIIINSTD